MNQLTTRRIEDSTPFHRETNWIMAGLSLAAAAVVCWWFELSWNFDVNSPEFNPAVFVPILLAGYGLVQAAKAARAQWMGRRFGATVFEMQGEQVAPGETLRGRIVTSRDLVASGGFTLRLRCIEQIRLSDSVGGARTRVQDKIRWEAEHKVEASQSHTTGVPVQFEIPPSVARKATSHPVRWTLEVEAPVDGARFEALFGVPVGTNPETESD